MSFKQLNCMKNWSKLAYTHYLMAPDSATEQWTKATFQPFYYFIMNVSRDAMKVFVIFHFK